MSDVKQEIEEQLKSNHIILYMKGTPEIPQCGFSAQVVDILGHYGKPYAFVNILDHPEIRQTLKIISDWPTFPQLYVDGDLVGGSDIIMEMHEANELESLL